MHESGRRSAGSLVGHRQSRCRLAGLKEDIDGKNRQRLRLCRQTRKEKRENGGECEGCCFAATCSHGTPIGNATILIGDRRGDCISVGIRRDILTGGTLP